MDQYHVVTDLFRIVEHMREEQDHRLFPAISSCGSKSLTYPELIVRNSGVIFNSRLFTAEVINHQLLEAVIALLLLAAIASGIFTLQPNKAVAVMFFGSYLGTVRKSGLWWSVPLATRRGISLRVRNFNSEILKVNDINGNPIEVAAVVVYRVTDSAKALFDVENYEKFVQIQSETALRHVASRYPYDAYEHDQHSSDADEWTGSLSLLDADRRIAKVLLNFGTRGGPNPGSHKLPVAKKNLAALLVL